MGITKKSSINVKKYIMSLIKYETQYKKMLSEVYFLDFTVLISLYIFQKLNV